MNWEQIIQKAGKQFIKKVYQVIDNTRLYVDENSINKIKISMNCKLIGTAMEEVELELAETLEDRPVYIEIMAKYGSDEVTKEIGPYYIYEERYNADKRSYTYILYDELLTAMTKYEPIDIEYPCTIQDFHDALCNKIRINSDVDDMINGNLIMESDIYENIDFTYRDVLNDIYEANGILVGLENRILKKYSLGTNEKVINDDILKNTNIDFGEHYGPINSIVLSRSAESDEIYRRDEQSISENGLCEFKIKDNQLMNLNNRADFLPGLLQQLGGIEYDIFDTELVGWGGFFPLQKVKIETGNNSYYSYCFNSEITYTNGYQEVVYTEMPEESTTDYTASTETDRLATNVSIIANKQNKKIESLIESVQEFTKWDETVQDYEYIVMDDAIGTSIVNLDLIPIETLPKEYSFNLLLNNKMTMNITTPEEILVIGDAHDILGVRFNEDTGKTELVIDKYIYKNATFQFFSSWDNTFILNSTGYYESNISGTSKSVPRTAIARIDFDIPYDNSIIEFEAVTHFAITNFAMIGKLDTELTSLFILDSLYECHWYKNGSQRESTEKIVFKNVPKGKHFIYVKYYKSTNTQMGFDNFRWKITKCGLANEEYQPGKEYVIHNVPIARIMINDDFPFILKNGFNELESDDIEEEPIDNILMKATYLKTTSTNKYFASRVELKTSFTILEDSIVSEVTRQIDGIDFGTKITQNADAVQIAWNQIDETIQFETNQGSAEMVIYNKDNEKIMALNKDGQEFFDGDEYIGKTGVEQVGNSKYIAFSVPIDYNQDIENGMSWGVHNVTDNIYLPILELSEYSMGPKDSGVIGGKLKLLNCDLQVDGTHVLQVGNVVMQGDAMSGSMAFLDTERERTFMLITPASEEFHEGDNITILDDIQIYDNTEGKHIFKVGLTNQSTFITNEGYISTYQANVTDTLDVHGVFTCYSSATIKGNLTVQDSITATNNISGRDIYGHLHETSHESYKKDIEKYNKEAIKEILNTDIYSFKYKDDKDNKTNIGAVIGESYRCSKEIISADEKHIDLYSMVALCFKAIQEQQEEIERLKKRLKGESNEINS